jgi:growth arrest-specific 1
MGNFSPLLQYIIVFQVMWLLAAVLAAAVAVAGSLRCQEAQLRCAYRSGCGTALENYELMCNDVLAEPNAKCTKACEYALIALTSTDEGKALMNVSSLFSF